MQKGNVDAVSFANNHCRDFGNGSYHDTISVFTYLSAKFKQESGQSLTDFILREKTEEAKRLLRYSGKSSAAIALYLGFSSPSHFSRAFRQYAGCNPGEYRERYN